jgi:alpha-L-rhamnosidase
MYGEIKSDWKIEGNQMIYDVTIPANTSATITLPSASPDEVLRNDEPLKSVSENFSQNEGNVTLELGSGEYRFSYPL